MRRRARVAAAAIAVLTTGLTAVAASASTAPLPGNTSVPPVYAKAETPALFDDDAGGNSNADDPAIWYDAARPGQSRIIGTAKGCGLHVYGLDGGLIQAVPEPPPTADGSASKFNNIDLLPNLRFPDGRSSSVAVVSDRGRDQIRFYRIDAAHPSAPLSDVTDAAVPFAFSATAADVESQKTAYGAAAWQDPTPAARTCWSAGATPPSRRSSRSPSPTAAP